MQCRDLVVEVLTLLVEALPSAARDIGNGGRRNLSTLGQVRRQLEEIERAARVTVSRTDQQAKRLIADGIASRQAPLRVLEGAAQDAGQRRLVEWLQDVDACPRQQSVIEFERRVLGRGADERQRPVLDKRQEGILL